VCIKNSHKKKLRFYLIYGFKLNYISDLFNAIIKRILEIFS